MRSPKPLTRADLRPRRSVREFAPAESPLKILMAAGEVSGDMQGGFLAQALLARDPTLRFFGIGGPRMKAAGVDLRIDATRFSSVGVLEAMRFIVPLRRVLDRLREIIRADRPDAVILIDNHGFNLMLARFLKSEKIPVIYYFPPQAWIASSVFAGGVARHAQLIISAFEKEAEIYRRHGGRAVSLGHPLLDIAKPGADPDAVLARLGIDASRPLVALMPGSRGQELERLAAPMFGAATIIQRRIPAVQFLLPVAASHLREPLREIRRRVGFAGEICEVEEDIYSCLSRCDLVVTTTGTSTLEAALLGVPMVATYRVHPFSALLGRMFASTRYVAMPNLLLEEFVVPEILQHDVTAERLAAAALDILENPSRQAAMRARFRELPGILGGEGALGRVAELVLKEISVRCQPSPSST
jgi:lipid-A-disaccharide synthase